MSASIREILERNAPDVVRARCGAKAIAELGEDGAAVLVAPWAKPLLDAVYAWRGESLIFSGPTGCGKTAAAVVFAYRIARRFRNWHWVGGIQLGNAYKMHPLGEGRPKLLERCESASVVVFDDPDWSKDDAAVTEVWAARYEARLPCIVTTGRALPEFVARYGDAVVRRILESGRGKGKVVRVEQPVETKR